MVNMIRKTVIVVLTLAAVGSGLLWVVGRVQAYRDPWKFEPMVWLDDASLRAYVDAGHLRARRTNTVNVGKQVTFPEIFRGPGSGLRQLRDIRFLGFYLTTTEGSLANTRTVRTVVNLPLWMPCLVFVAYPTLAFIRGPLRRYRRRKRGLCVTCGYDLRGSPERCPECGEAV